MAQVINNLSKVADRKMNTIMTSDDAVKIGNAISEVKSEAYLRAQDLKDQAEQAVARASALVKDKPLYFIGGAAVVGLLAGYLLARPSR